MEVLSSDGSGVDKLNWPLSEPNSRPELFPKSDSFKGEFEILTEAEDQFSGNDFAGGSFYRKRKFPFPRNSEI